jgi:hypothetical protein
LTLRNEEKTAFRKDLHIKTILSVLVLKSRRLSSAREQYF